MEHWKDKLKLRLPAIVLLAVTLLFWSFYDRFEPAGPALLESATLATATRYSGEVTEEGGCFCLTVPPGGKRAQVRFRIPEAAQYDYIRVRARIKTDQVVVGKYAWHCARIIFAQYDAGDKWIPGRHGLPSESGTMKRAYREQVFEIFPDTAYGEVAILQYGLSGSAEFDRIEVQPVRVRTFYGFWRVLFILLWLGMLALFFPRCRMNTRKLKVLILLNAIAILYGTMMPSLYITKSSAWVKDTIQQAVEKPGNPPAVASGKKPGDSAAPAAGKHHEDSLMDQLQDIVGEAHQVGHFVLFSSLCFLVYWSAALEKQHRSYYIKVLFDILLFAAITEALQLLTFDRSAGFFDLLTDFYGMLSGLVLFVLLKTSVKKSRLALSLF